MAKLELIREQVAQDENIIDLPIYQKDGQPYLAADGVTPSTIGIFGSESKSIHDAKQAIQRVFLASPKTRLDPSDVFENRVALAAAGVARLTGWEGDDDQPMPYSRENAVVLISSADHILEQVEEGIKRHAAVFKTASSR